MERGCETVNPCFDPLLAAYLLNPDREKYSFETIILEMTGEFINREQSSGMHDYAYRLMRNYNAACGGLMKQIEERNQTSLLKDVEVPLSLVLAAMEMSGVMVEPAVLKELAARLDGMIHEMENRIYSAAGMIFNINSPKQLADVLFVRCGLKPKKKTKTGFSTDMAVLEELADEGESEIPALIIEQRAMQKLRSTYTDNLIDMINGETGRIHTRFNQTVTGTGRLSSSEPNLQNIPVRSELGREIRKAFVAPPGSVLMSADYSQIELRILAHLSGDEHLTDAFIKGEDIHTRTAMEIFGVMEGAVTGDIRRAAKTINFGILYGMSAFRLGRDLKIDVRAAHDIIERYFARLGGVKEYLDKTVEFAGSNGYVATMFGRRRYIADIGNPNKNVRAFAERMAINAPVQGSAADIIKIAMIRLHKALTAGGFKSRIILQVHDELLLEVPDGEIDEAGKTVKEIMENAASLSVPLTVDIRT
ncbi:MAG: DNA polymerase I, partial [Deltaproteobacteria bacterium]|nr:DNA polymerase I [Deltaproteobacteria bacterium]